MVKTIAQTLGFTKNVNEFKFGDKLIYIRDKTGSPFKYGEILTFNKYYHPRKYKNLYVKEHDMSWMEEDFILATPATIVLYATKE